MTTKASIITAAIQWWRALRPTGWNQEQHLADPTTGTVGPAERDLARAVAKHVKEGKA